MNSFLKGGIPLKLSSYIYSGLVGLFGGVGFVCAFTLMTILAFDTYSQHPIAFPASSIGGFIALIICIVATILYMIDLVKSKTYRYIPLHFVNLVVFFVVGYCLTGLM